MTSNKRSNTWPLFLRYKVLTEREYRRAIEEFERLKALRHELPNKPILEAEPEANETPCDPLPTDPIPPQDPVLTPPPAPPGPPAQEPGNTADGAIMSVAQVPRYPVPSARKPRNTPGPWYILALRTLYSGAN